MGECIKVCRIHAIWPDINIKDESNDGVIVLSPHYNSAFFATFHVFLDL